MKQRAEAARRIVRVREQMAKLAEWRHLEGEQLLAAAEAARAELDRFAAETQPLGALARAVATQSGRLDKRHELASERRNRSAAALAQAQRQVKTAETISDRLTRAARDASERRDLELLIELFGAAKIDPASLP